MSPCSEVEKDTVETGQLKGNCRTALDLRDDLEKDVPGTFKKIKDLDLIMSKVLIDQSLLRSPRNSKLNWMLQDSNVCLALE